MSELEPTRNEGKAQKRGGAWLMWSAALGTLVSGVMCVFAVKLQSLHDAPINASGEMASFTQPFWQTFIMFCGECFCFFVWIIDDRRTRAGKQAKPIFEFPTPADLAKPLMHWWWWSASAALDLTGTSMVNAAFAMTYGSTVQMLRNSILVMTSFMTMGMMRRPLRVHEWLGILIMTGGMVASGIMAVIHPDESSTVAASKSWIGIMLSLIGTVFNALQLIVEEKMFQKRYYPPMKAMGCQGFIGVFLTVIVIIVCHFAGWYNFQHAWYQMNHKTSILVANIWYLVVVFIFNGCGLMTTFLGTGLLRGVIYACRAPIIFLIELAIKWQAFTIGGLVSLILTILGFAFYAYLLPFINKRKTPAVHKVLRCGIPCLCTVPLPDSDDEGEGETYRDATGEFALEQEKV